MRVHCLNLDRRPDRLRDFARANRHLSDAVRFAAIDGQALDLPDLARRAIVTADILDSHTPGQLGCALSHAAMWEHAIQTGEQMTVCEDDAVFNRGFERCAEALIAALPEGWDLVLWGWNFDLFMGFEMLPGVSHSLCLFDQPRMREAIADFQDRPVSPVPFKLIWAFGTPCYTISVKGARRLWERLLPFRPFDIHFPEAERAPPYNSSFHVLSVDGAMNSVYREMNAFVAFPPLVLTPNESG